MKSHESARERLRVIVAVFDGKVDEFGMMGDEVGGGTGKPAFADVFGETNASDKGKKPAHDVGISAYICCEAIVVDGVVEMLLDFGGNLIEGTVDVHRDSFGSLGYYNIECMGKKVVIS